MRYIEQTALIDGKEVRLHESSWRKVLTRAELAKVLRLSPNRVSELVNRGVIDPYHGSGPGVLEFVEDHAASCYGHYKRWHETRKHDEKYFGEFME